MKHSEGNKDYKGVAAKIRLEKILKELIRLKNGKGRLPKRLAAKKAWLTQDKLKEQLTYDPETGIFTNNKTGYEYKAHLGSEPLFQIRIGKLTYNAHELAWFCIQLDYGPTIQLALPVLLQANLRTHSLRNVENVFLVHSDPKLIFLEHFCNQTLIGFVNIALSDLLDVFLF